MGLTDTQQAELTLVAFVLVPIAAWLSLGAPTTHTALAALGASIIIGVLLFFKEYLGINVPLPQTSTPPTPTPPSTATKTPTAFLRLRKRLIFLQLRK